MNKQDLQLKIVSTIDQFKKLESCWNELASDNPMLSWDWMFSWWEAFQRGHELNILEFQSSKGTTIGIVPFYKTISRSGARVIRTLGSGSACSDYLRAICKDENRSEVEAALAHAIFESAALKRRLARWDFIELDAHCQQEFAELKQGMRQQHCTVHQHELESSWVTELSGENFDEFQQTLKRSFRRKTRKAQKNLAQGKVQFEIIDNLSELEKVWPAFCRLHQLRREMLGQEGCFADPRFEAFLRAATSRLAKRNMAGLARAQADGRDLGFVLLLRTPTTFLKYQSGMDPAASHWEPGHLLTSALVADAIECGCTHYDFLRGDEPYKRFWNSKQVPLYKTRIVAPRVASRLRHGIWSAARNFKHGIEAMRAS